MSAGEKETIRLEAFSDGVFAIAIAFWILLWAAFRKSVLDPAANEATMQRLRSSYRFGPPMYAAAALVGPFVPWLALAICSGLRILWAVTTREC
jgi:uncharacterized membrane protein